MVESAAYQRPCPSLSGTSWLHFYVRPSRLARRRQLVLGPSGWSPGWSCRMMTLEVCPENQYRPQPHPAPIFLQSWVWDDSHFCLISLLPLLYWLLFYLCVSSLPHGLESLLSLKDLTQRVSQAPDLRPQFFLCHPLSEPRTRPKVLPTTAQGTLPHLAEPQSQSCFSQSSLSSSLPSLCPKHLLLTFLATCGWTCYQPHALESFGSWPPFPLHFPLSTVSADFIVLCFHFIVSCFP